MSDGSRTFSEGILGTRNTLPVLLGQGLRKVLVGHTVSLTQSKPSDKVGTLASFFLTPLKPGYQLFPKVGQSSPNGEFSLPQVASSRVASFLIHGQGMLERASLKSSVCSRASWHMQGVVIWRKRLRGLLLEAVFSPASRTRVVCVS